jgi:ribose transport system substrate-binding protein
VILIVFISKQFGEEKPKVVVVVKNLDLNYWGIVKAGAEKGFEDFGIDGKVIAPRTGTVEEQRDILENVLKEPPDVLVVAPVYSPDLISELEKFVENDIPVLLMGTDDPWKNKTSYIGTDNLELGKKAGILMASQLQPGDKVALLGGQQPSAERLKGAKGSLEAAGVKIATEKEGLSNNNTEVIRGIMETILREHPDIKGVITTSDYIALPVIEVIQEHGLEMPVTGADGITEVLELIEEGTLSSAVAQNPYDMGYLSVQTALKAAKGEKVNQNIDSSVDIITEGSAKQRLDFYNDVLR